MRWACPMVRSVGATQQIIQTAAVNSPAINSTPTAVQLRRAPLAATRLSRRAVMS